MKKLIRNFLLILLIFGGVAKAQVDPHFSQYYAYPLYLNPALTGIMDGDVRLTGNVKDQWASVDNGYKTAAFSGDFRTSEKVALGFNIIDQQAGTAGYNYLGAYGSFAYQISVSANKYQKVNFGLQAGVINRSFNPNKLQLDNQYNPVTGGYDETLPTYENFTATNSTIFDASAGVFYYDGNPANDFNVFGGVSAAHLAQTKAPVGTGTGLSSPIPFRYTIHGGVRIRASESIDLTPHFIYINQQNNKVTAAGLNAEFMFQADHSLIIGGMYRLNDAAVANVGFHLNNLVFGLSYDYTTSQLQTAVNPQGTYELSISYIIKHHLSERAQICPRL